LVGDAGLNRVAHGRTHGVRPYRRTRNLRPYLPSGDTEDSRPSTSSAPTEQARIRRFEARRRTSVSSDTCGRVVHERHHELGETLCWQIKRAEPEQGGKRPGITFRSGPRPGRPGTGTNPRGNQMFAARARSSGPSTVNPAWPRGPGCRAPSAPTTYWTRTVSVGLSVTLADDAGEHPRPDLAPRADETPTRNLMSAPMSRARPPGSIGSKRGSAGSSPSAPGSPRGRSAARSALGPPRFPIGPDLQAPASVVTPTGCLAIRCCGRGEPRGNRSLIPRCRKISNGALVDDVRTRRCEAVPPGAVRRPDVPRRTADKATEPKASPAGPAPDDQARAPQTASEPGIDMGRLRLGAITRPGGAGLLPCQLTRKNRQINILSDISSRKTLAEGNGLCFREWQLPRLRTEQVYEVISGPSPAQRRPPSRPEAEDGSKLTRAVRGKAQSVHQGRRSPA